MSEGWTQEQELVDIKYQLAHLAFDIFSLRLHSAISIPFSELDADHKNAWVEGVWAAVEVSSSKRTKIPETVTLKQQDNGYLVYAGCKEIKKSHANLFTYSKFPENIKNMYRDLALKIYQKIDAEEDNN